MAQTTASQTSPQGLVVNSVVDTEKNTVTYTATAPNGAVAVNTVPKGTGGNSTENLNALRSQLQAQGYNDPAALGPGLNRAATKSGTEADEEADRVIAQRRRELAANPAAAANPPVQETKPIPANTTQDPSAPQPQNTQTPVTSTAPAPLSPLTTGNSNSLPPVSRVDVSPTDVPLVPAPAVTVPESAAATVDQNNSPYASQRAQQQTGVPEQAPATVDQGNSPYASQRAQQQTQQVESAEPAPVTAREAGIADANEAAGRVIAPAPGTVETFRPNESTITAVNKEPGPDTYETGGGGGNQGTITRVTYTPQDVPPTEDPAAGEAAANDQQSTITGARGGNVQENENIAAANQAATEERLRQQQAIQAQFQSPANGDWRVKLKLPPQATYLYKDTSNILMQPLAASDGVVFPYMPEIQTSYNANYDTSDLTHSNYRGYFYKNSYVGDINISGVFTAQNTQEAHSLLAVIHFFRSATKMFYGEKDAFRGAPPPLVYLFGLGQYQFQAHPCVIRSFTYNLPNDVDYIRTKPNNYNVNFNDTLPKTESGGNPISAVFNRLRNALLPKGALPNVPQELLTVSQSVSNIDNSTYVPTKITVQISLLPIQTRNQQSQQFSVKGFASGDLLKGGFW